MAKTHKSGERESPTRRTFIQSVTAGAAAAAGLAAGSGASAALGATEEAGVTARRHVRVAFNPNRATTIEDVRAAVEKAAGLTACTRCGFDGIDVLLRREEILEPDPTPWIVTTWGQEAV